MKLKFTWLVAEDVDMTKKQYLHLFAIAYTHTTTAGTIITAFTAARSKAIAINSTGTTTNTTTITAGTSNC